MNRVVWTLCRKVVVYTIPIFLSIALFIHFFLITLHVMPKNPISNEISPIVNTYVSPLFTQNWHLFSPNPLMRNDVVYMQLKFKDSSTPSDWFDITTPMLKANYKNYFSPMNRIVRIPLTAATTMNGMNDEELKFVSKLDKKHMTKEQSLMLEDIEKRAKESRERMKSLLYRFAFATAEKYFSDKQIDSVRVRIVHEQAVPFSKRLDKNFKKERTHEDLEWMKFEPVISW